MNAGGVVIEILGSVGGVVSTQQDLTNWIVGHNMPLTTAIDAEGEILAANNALGPHHHYWLINLEDMTVVSDGVTPPVTGIQEAIDLLSQ